MMITKIQVWVPATFWLDHDDREPCDHGRAGLCIALRHAGNRVLIEGTAAQIECLRADAVYYSHDGPDQAYPGLIRSARATLKALANV